MPFETAYSFLLAKRDGPVARVTLNRPDVHNAFNAELIGELIDAFGRLAANREIRAVILAGNGRSFCAGGDIHWMRSMKGAAPGENIADAKRLMAMLRALAELPQVAIARVHGAARGGGVGLACCCDLVVASTRASFALTEVLLGLSAATITPCVVRTLGEQNTRRMMLTAERIDADRALAIGLADRVCEEDRIDAAVQDYVDLVLQGGPEAIATAKKALDAIRSTHDAELDGICATLLAERRASDEGQEGLSAFLEKRKPRWQP